MKTLVICSGGLNSVTLARKIAVERALTRFVSFDCAQRHRKELNSAQTCTARLGVSPDIVGILAMGHLLTRSALNMGAA